MFSSLGTMQSIRYFPVGLESQTFSSFPSSLKVRYDLYYDTGRQTASGSSVTTNNAHIYKILDKSGNNYDLISVSTDSTPSNKYISSGLGLNKPCVSIDSTTANNTTATTGYYVSGTSPQFSDGFELICVIRPLQFTVTGSNVKSQNLVNKYISGSGFPQPFTVRTNRAIGNGSSSSSWDNSANLNMLGTHSTGFIMGTRFFKANSTLNGNTTPNGTAQERLNGTDNGTYAVSTPSNYVESASAILGLCYRPVLPNQNQAFEVGEILMFNAPLAPADRELIEGYLATKWGIPITNTSHTYYNKNVNYNGSNP